MKEKHYDTKIFYGSEADSIATHLNNLVSEWDKVVVEQVFELNNKKILIITKCTGRTNE